MSHSDGPSLFAELGSNYCCRLKSPSHCSLFMKIQLETCKVVTKANRRIIILTLMFISQNYCTLSFKMIPITVCLFFVLTFTIPSFHFIHCIGKDGILCHETEKQALLSFKKSLKDPSNTNQLFSYWNSQVDCCMWVDVICSNLTGNVLELHLQSLDLKKPLDRSLLNLKHLRYLDLSENNFQGTIPPFIGSFPKLEYLNLSNAGFGGTIPRTIGNLSSLRTLALRVDFSSPHSVPLDVESLEWLKNLSHLEHLDLSFVDLSKENNWPQVINTLPSLAELNFRSCSLYSIAPLNEVNFSSLTFLDLSLNSFQSVSNWIFQLGKLTYLDLSSNNIEATFPSTANLTNLQYFDTSGNKFNSTIPDWLYKCKYIEHISMEYNSLQGLISRAVGNLTSLNFFDLSDNELSGEIPSEISRLCNIWKLDLHKNMFHGDISNSFGNMSKCFLQTMEDMNLEQTRLSGHLNNQFGKFRSIRNLDLGYNSLFGPIPNNLGNLVSLESLRLDDNKFTGNLPESMGQLLNLYSFSVTDNMLEGRVTETHFANLTNLNSFSASGNRLTFKVDEKWIPVFKVSNLELGSWNLGAKNRIPPWLNTQKNYIENLDLSNTGMACQVPNWFWEIPFLNLSHNQLHGKIPDIINGSQEIPQFIYLSSNLFNGSLPQLGNWVTEFDLSNNSFSRGLSHLLCDTISETNQLEILHLGGNLLSGELPDCWMRWQLLKVLNIGNNNISGSIPKSIRFLENLQSLNLFNNNLSGQISSSLQMCTSLMKIDLANNHLLGKLPAWLGISMVDLRILILRSNKMTGKISSSICHLNSLQILDLSDNLFSGFIPSCVDNFTAMATRKLSLKSNSGEVELSYSYYKGMFLESASITTKGTQLEYDTILGLVTSIDLSRNSLSGEIPYQLTKLAELRTLNLSGNQLRGSIPDQIGDMKQLESLDLSRNTLTGGIPNTLTVLSSLNYLNVSYNNLTGRIPESTQILSLPASGFIGNNLCGPPLTSNCSQDSESPGSGRGKGDDEDSDSEFELLYVFISLGYAVGFSVVCNVLIFKKAWRDAFFAAFDNMWNKLCLYVRMRRNRC